MVKIKALRIAFLLIAVALPAAAADDPLRGIWNRWKDEIVGGEIIQAIHARMPK